MKLNQSLASIASLEDFHTHMATETESELLRKQQAYGADHICLVPPLSRLGLLYQHMAKDDARAVHYHTEARRILELQLNEELSSNRMDDDASDQQRTAITEDLAATLNDLAFLHERQGDIEAAARDYTTAQHLLENIDCSHKKNLLDTCTRGLARLFRSPTEAPMTTMAHHSTSSPSTRKPINSRCA